MTSYKNWPKIVFIPRTLNLQRKKRKTRENTCLKLAAVFKKLPLPCALFKTVRLVRVEADSKDDFKPLKCKVKFYRSLSKDVESLYCIMKRAQNVLILLLAKKISEAKQALSDLCQNEVRSAKC